MPRLAWVGLLAAAVMLPVTPYMRVAFAAPPPPKSKASTLARRDAPDPVTPGVMPKSRPRPEQPQRKTLATGPSKNVGITVQVVPTIIPAPSVGFELWQNIPNQSRGPTAFAFSLARPEFVSITVYDVTGKKVTTLVRGTYGAGRYDVRWEARDDQGRLCKPGLYFYRMDAGAFHHTRKLILR